MRGFAKAMQFVGLTLPPVSMFLQLAGAISLGQMLTMLVASVSAFGIGWIVAGYAR